MNYLHILEPSFWNETNVIIHKIPEFQGLEHFATILFALFGILLSYLTIIVFHGIVKSIHILVFCFAIFVLLFSKYLTIILLVGYISILLSQKIITNILKNKYYFDEIYNFLFIQNIKKLSNFFWKTIDVKFIDFIPNGIVNLVNFCSRSMVNLQTGYIYHYALLMILGFILIAFVI